MSRHANAAAAGRILESLFLLRSSRLVESVTDGPAPAPDSSSEEGATHSARQLLREAVLGAVEIEAVAGNTHTSVPAVQPSPLTKGHAAPALSATAWRPRREIGTVLEGRDLHKIDLAGGRVSASFSRSDLSESLLLGTYFANCTFNSCDLCRADMSGAQFHSCTFLSADATAAVARRAHFSHCVFHRADLSDWDAAGATFFQCSFAMSDLSRWHVDGQTTVVKPTDWGRCRRLDWVMKPGSPSRQCRVVGDASATAALSLAPAEESACRRRPQRL
ncbi:Pentapeptide repeats (9 copies) [Novymonas esmeraldas]|uniref:Pentapeptide repeats (9 copies) n=1 Tax=Novymonas esmeraldas TaxID=1808958 RepID=A0AAW0F1M1_9TRYP